MKPVVTTNAAEFSKNLLAYANASSRGFSIAIHDQARELSHELFRQFRSVRPNPGTTLDTSQIFLEAKARGFSVSRRPTPVVAVTEGVSARAHRAAREALGGETSDYFQPEHGGGLKPVRFSRQKGNAQVLSKTIYKTRKNPLLLASQLPQERLKTLRQEQQAKGYVRMNLRALSVYYELLFRRRGGLGGIMAVQWNHKKWKRAKRFDPASGFQTLLNSERIRPAAIVDRTRDGKILGTVDFDYDTIGNLVAVNIRGYVPGSHVQAARHGLVDKAFAARAADLLTATANAHKKAARSRGL